MPNAIEQLRQLHKAVAATADVHVKAASIKGPSVDMKERTVSGCISVALPDLDAEVVLPEGLDRWYFPDKVKAVYFNHQYDQMPVAKCINMAVRDGGKSLYATTYIMPSAFGDDLLTAMDKGVIGGFSVGYVPEDRGPPTEAEQKAYGSCQVITRKGMLLEYSITPMPMNPGALVELVSKAAIHRSSAVAFGMPDDPKVKVTKTWVHIGGKFWSKA